MIGHFLLTLAPEQEDRLLTGTFGPLFGPDECDRCFMMRAMDTALWISEVCRLEPLGVGDPTVREPGYVYERLADRFGAARVNNAIRNRILSNRARRMLQNIGVGVGEDRPAL